MVRATKVVTRAKDYGSSQVDLWKEPPPTERPLHIENPMDKPDIVPHIPKGVLKHSGHNPISEPPRTIPLSRIWAKLLV